jgi:hypothetical protein
MLIKEANMRRVLFLILALVLLMPAGAAFADAPAGLSPQVPDQAAPALLGEVWFFLGTGYYPFERVDVYLYAPSTLAGWPYTTGPDFGTYFMPIGESEMRRQSYAEDFLYADEFGYYYAEFLLPRDEAWYPCSFPLKWKCNYTLAGGAVEYHSPAAMAYECEGILCLTWPYAVDPMDTVAPMEAWMIGEYALSTAPSPVYVFPFEVLGMYWKFSDIP